MTETTPSIFDTFVFEPTECQSKALFLIEEFIQKPQTESAFVLRGSAGTGKTSLMQAVVQYLKTIGVNYVLLAPTGKAVKVLSKRVADFASTVHSQIYIPEELKDEKIKFNFRSNESEVRTIFIVDEASMLRAKNLSSEDFNTPNSILDDLIRFIKGGNSENQVIFIGDIYQLPPVNEEESVALSATDLAKYHYISAQEATLNKVMRQADDSSILTLANEIKFRKDTESSLNKINLERFKSENVAISYFLENFDKNNLENIIIIALSNKRVQELNIKVRQQLGLANQAISAGDVVMLNRNWMSNTQRLTKGELGIVHSTTGIIENRMGLQFTDAIIEFDGLKIETKILIDSLLSEKGDIDREVMKGLKNDRMAKNKDYRATEKSSDDPYMSALHLRYGYAITCHKAQGSEWDKVLIEPKFNLGNHRWLYTAVTRARDEVCSWWY